MGFLSRFRIRLPRIRIPIAPIIGQVIKRVPFVGPVVAPVISQLLDRGSKVAGYVEPDLGGLPPPLPAAVIPDTVPEDDIQKDSEPAEDVEDEEEAE